MATTAISPRTRLRAAAAHAKTRPITWVTAGALLAAAAGLVYVHRIVGYFVMTDEMTYFKGSFDIWTSKDLLHPGDVYYSTWGQLAPLLRAPAFVFGRTTTAYEASRMINVLAFASSAIPVYLLASRLVRPRAVAVLAGVLSVAVPWLAVTGTMLTEPMTYPAFCWALFAMQRAVAQPGVRADLLAVLGIGLAFFGRTQLAVLAPALVVAVLLHEATYPLLAAGSGGPLAAWRSNLASAARRHAVLIVLTFAGLAIYVKVGRSHIVDELLGSYAQTASGSLLPVGTWSTALAMVASVGIACGVLPLALAIGWMLHSLVRPIDREAHAFACLAAVVCISVSAVAASFVVRFTNGAGLTERYLMYLAPILFIGMLLALLLRRAPVSLALGGLAALWICHGHHLYEAPGSPLSAAAPFHSVLNARMHELASALAPATTLGYLALAATLVLAVPRRVIAPRTMALSVGGAVLVFCAAETVYTLRDISSRQSHSAQFIELRDWIDRSLPDGAQATAVLGEASTPRASAPTWWDALFYNRKLRLAYKDTAGVDQAWGQTAVQLLSVDERTGALHGLGAARYVVRSAQDRRWPIAGAKVIRQVGDLQLQQVPAAKRVPWTLRGTGETGVMTPGVPATIRVFDPRRGRAATIVLTQDAHRAPLSVVRIDDGRRIRTIRLAPGTTRTVRVALTGPAGRAAQIRLLQVRRPWTKPAHVQSITL